MTVKLTKKEIIKLLQLLYRQIDASDAIKNVTKRLEKKLCLDHKKEKPKSDSSREQ